MIFWCAVTQHGAKAPISLICHNLQILTDTKRDIFSTEISLNGQQKMKDIITSQVIFSEFSPILFAICSIFHGAADHNLKDCLEYQFVHLYSDVKHSYFIHPAYMKQV